MLCELHCHSTISGDALATIEEIIRFSEKKLDAIAITEHDSFEGYHRAKKIRGNILLIPGIEISTQDGHMLAYGIQSLNFRKGDDSFEIVDKIHAAGGIAVTAHPFRPMKGFDNEKIFEKVDAIEAVNGNNPRYCNDKAIEASKKFKKPMTSGSDAHRLQDIGTFPCEIKADNVDEIIKAIKKGRTKIAQNNTTLFGLGMKIVDRRARKFLRNI